MLQDTIVVWATESGRSPGVEIRANDTGLKGGRDHHPFVFTTWMAGGGIKGGMVHGATDELGFHAVENRHYVTDIHATVLHQLGLDPHRLEVPGQKRLEIDFGEPIKEIIALKPVKRCRGGNGVGMVHPAVRSYLPMRQARVNS